MIMSRIRRIRKEQCLTAAALVDRVSLRYNLSPSTYRSLEASIKSPDTYTSSLDQWLITELAIALTVPLSDLASPEELSIFPAEPLRRAQKDPPRTTAYTTTARARTPRYVHNPRKTASRLEAFMKQKGYNRRSFRTALEFRGYHTTEDQLRSIFTDRPHLLTRELLEAAAEVFSHQYTATEPFIVDRLLFCTFETFTQPCPHCYEWLRY